MKPRAQTLTHSVDEIADGCWIVPEGVTVGRLSGGRVEVLKGRVDTVADGGVVGTVRDGGVR